MTRGHAGTIVQVRPPPGAPGLVVSTWRGGGSHAAKAVAPPPAARTFWLWFGGVWLLVGVPFLCIGLAVGVRAYHRHERLDREGLPATGTVLVKSVSPGEDGSGDERVEYRFRTSGGRVVRDEARLSAAAWDRLAERGPVRVTYLPGDPGVHRIDGEKDDRLVLGGIFTVLGGVLTVLGGFVFLRGWEIRRRAARRPRQSV